jgi:hypothetical protein
MVERIHLSIAISDYCACFVLQDRYQRHNLCVDRALSEGVFFAASRILSIRFYEASGHLLCFDPRKLDEHIGCSLDFLL